MQNDKDFKLKDIADLLEETFSGHSTESEML